MNTEYYIFTSHVHVCATYTSLVHIQCVCAHGLWKWYRRLTWGKLNVIAPWHQNQQRPSKSFVSGVDVTTTTTAGTLTQPSNDLSCSLNTPDFVLNDALIWCFRTCSNLLQSPLAQGRKTACGMLCPSLGPIEKSTTVSRHECRAHFLQRVSEEAIQSSLITVPTVLYRFCVSNFWRPPRNICLASLASSMCTNPEMSRCRSMSYHFAPIAPHLESLVKVSIVKAFMCPFDLVLG